MTSWARLWLVPEIGNALWVEPGLRPQKKRGWNLGTMHRKLPETSLEATSTVLHVVHCREGEELQYAWKHGQIINRILFPTSKSPPIRDLVPPPPPTHGTMLMMSANNTPPNALSTTMAAYERQPALANTPEDRSQKVRLPSINKLFPRQEQPPDPVFQPAQHYVHTPHVPAVFPGPYASPPSQPVVYTAPTMFPMPQPVAPAAVAMSPSESQDSVPSPTRRQSVSRDSRFKCDQCHKSYTRKHNLISHKLSVHEKEKLFGCTECQVKFSRSSDLSRHTKEQHSSIVKPFVCGGVNPDGTAWGCGKRFYRKDQLKSHLNTTKAGYKCLRRNFAIMMVPGEPDPASLYGL